MLKKSIYLITSLLVVFSMLAVASPAFALTTTRRHVSGRVVALNQKTHVLTVKNALGKKFALKFTYKTNILKNGKRVGFAGMHVGDKVSLNYTSPIQSPSVGSVDDGYENSSGYDLHGTVAAVDTTLNTVTVTPFDGGSSVTLNVDSTTVITRNGAPATLANLAFGDKIEAQYNSATMLASVINAESDAQSSEVEGTISAVDTTLGTITITPQDGSADVTLSTASSTVIMLDDNPAALANLQTGFQVEAKYDSTSLLASFIDAESQSSDSASVH
jgi:hypothetical protein